MREMGLIVAAGLALLPFAAQAQGGLNPDFDVEQATRAYLGLLQGPARAKSDAYFEGGYWLIAWNAVVSAAVCAVLLFTGWSARMRDWAEARGRWRRLVPALYALPFVVATTLLLLPWTIYVEFLRERQYGLMSQSFGEWGLDTLKSVGIGLVIYPLMAMAIYAAIRKFRRTWWLVGAGLMIAFVAIGALIAPVFIAPLFNTYTEMPAGPLRDRIVAVAKANAIPSEHIYVSDASRQTKRISANVSGLGPTIRITLNDNLLKRTGPDEVLAVMGHEMGHYVLDHVRWLIVSFGLAFAAIFFAVSRIAPRLIARFPRWGVRDVADPASAPLLLGLAAITGALLTPYQNTVIRLNESAADMFGLDSAREPDGFAKVAMRLSEYRKIEPGPVEEFLFFDHPSGATRVRMSMQWKKDHVPNAVMVKPTITLD